MYSGPYTWSTTPQLLGVPTGGNVGWGSAQLQSGIVAVGAITDGVADQGVEDWLQAVYDAPNPTGTAAAWDSLTVHAHVDAIVLSNNFGLFSNVSASFLRFFLQAEGAQDVQNVSVNTGVTVGPPDVEDIETLAQYLDLASSEMQSAATNAIAVAQGQASPESAFVNSLGSAFGEAVYQTDLTLSVGAYVSGAHSQPVDIQLSPELGVANAGLGITGTYAVSLVQLTVSGTSTPAGSPTSLSLGLLDEHGQPLPNDSRGLAVTRVGEPLELKATVHDASGNVITVSGSQVHFGVAAISASQPLSCTLEQGSCTAILPAATPLPTGFQSVTANWEGTGTYAGSSTSQLVEVGPGESTLALEPLWPGGTDVMAGQPYKIRVHIQGSAGTNLLQLATGGTVTLLDDGSPAGSCMPVILSETSGDGCDITWVPTLGPDVATRSVRLEATWTGNEAYTGAAQDMATRLTVAHPGVGLFLAAEPPALGHNWAVVCTTNDVGATICKPKLTLTTSGKVTAEVLSNGEPVQDSDVQLSSKAPATLSAPDCTTGRGGTCTVAVSVPASKTTLATDLVATTTQAAGQVGRWRQDLELLDVGLYGAHRPRVSGVSPANGPTSGGNTVQIRGEDLWNATAVRFGGVLAPSLAVQSDGSILAVAPRGEGTCDVEVTTALGTSAPSAHDRYRFASSPSTTPSGSTSVTLPGDLNGLLGLRSGGAFASLSPSGARGAPAERGAIVQLRSDGTLDRRYRAPFTAGEMSLFGKDLFYAARTGTSYTNWQTTLVRLSTLTGSSVRSPYTAGPVGPGGVALGADGSPVYLGVSTVGGPYGLPVLLELSRSGRWTARGVPSPQGGGVGGLAAGTGQGLWGIVPKSSEVFWLSSPNARFRRFIAPGTTTPVSLDAITADGDTAYAAVSGAAPGTVGIFRVDSADGATMWLRAPRDVAAVSGVAWDNGLWTGAVTSTGEAGVLGYSKGTWRFAPIVTHVAYSARLLLAQAGSGSLWFGVAGSDRLWKVRLSLLAPLP